jgi:hypothetical protein
MDIGGLGPHESEPVPLEWQWYYHFPSFAGWALIVALLWLIKENRSRQAWLILIPFLLLSEILRPWTESILRTLSSRAEQTYGLPLQWLVVVWTAVWLTSPWLARRRPAVAFVGVLMCAAIVGIVAEFCLHQTMYVNELQVPYFVGLHVSQAIYWIGISALSLAFVLSSLCCRKRYGPTRFLVWLALWLSIGVAVGMIGEVVWMAWKNGRLASLPYRLPRVALVSVCMAGLLYVLNLPFMILAFRCPMYGDRFRKLLRLPERVQPAAIVSDSCPRSDAEEAY